MDYAKTLLFVLLSVNFQTYQLPIVSTFDDYDKSYYLRILLFSRNTKVGFEIFCRKLHSILGFLFVVIENYLWSIVLTFKLLTGQCAKLNSCW